MRLEAPKDKIRTLGICLGLALMTLAVYGQVRHFGFMVIDDSLYVTGNPRVQAGLTWEGLVWAFRSIYAANWHPLTWLSLMLDCQLFGREPGWHHLVNVGLHVANTWLLFLVLQRMTGAVWRSALVAGLFALHPLHVESVVWIAERKDVLSTFFFLLTILTYAEYAKSRLLPAAIHPFPSSWFYLFSLFLFALGLMAKPMLVTLPFVLLLLDFWPIGRWRGWKVEKRAWVRPEVKTLLIEKTPFFILSILSCLVTFWSQKAGGAIYPVSLGARLDNATGSYVGYLGKMLWPVHLAVGYAYPADFQTWRVLGAAALLGVLTVSAIFLRRSRPYWTMGWFWYLGTLMPVIGLVKEGEQAMADRYTYIPLIGLFVALVWALADLAGSKCGWRRVFSLSGLMLLATCGWMAYRQVGYWKNDMTLFAHALAVAPPTAGAHSNLGVELLKEHRYAEAKSHFEMALKLRPDNPEDHSNLGIVLCEEGKFDEGLSHFSEAINARNQPETHNNWGLALSRLGRTNEALAHFLSALQADPFNAGSHVFLGRLLSAQGKKDEALAHFREALRCRPGSGDALAELCSTLAGMGQTNEALQLLNKTTISAAGAETHHNLGRAWLVLGKKSEATKEFQEALRLDPGHLSTHLQLGTLFLQAGNLAAACEHNRAAVAADPSSAEAHYQLAYVLVQQKEMEGIKHYREAMRLKPDWITPINDLAWLLATSHEAKYRDGPEAVLLAARALVLTESKEVNTLDTAAAAYAAAGRFPEAVATAEKALELAKGAQEREMAGQIESRLQLYRSGKAYRE